MNKQEKKFKKNRAFEAKKWLYVIAGVLLTQYGLDAGVDRIVRLSWGGQAATHTTAKGWRTQTPSLQAIRTEPGKSK